ncbi:hypothetical protein A6R68_15119, partial [Neotoma lepida]
MEVASLLTVKSQKLSSKGRVGSAHQTGFKPVLAYLPSGASDNVTPVTLEDLKEPSLYDHPAGDLIGCHSYLTPSGIVILSWRMPGPRSSKSGTMTLQPGASLLKSEAWPPHSATAGAKGLRLDELCPMQGLSS